jgi:ribose transport system substrate-binding protein
VVVKLILEEITMKIQRIILLLALALMAVTVLAACQPAAEEGAAPAEEEAAPAEEEAAEEAAPGGQYEITIGYVPPQTILVWNVAEQYMQIAADQGAEYGFDITIITQAPVVDTEFSDQGRIIDDFIQRGVDVLVIGPIDIPPLIAPIQRANEAGIPVIVLNMLDGFPEDEVDVLAYVGMSNYEAGLMCGQWAAETLGGEGNVAIIQGIVGSIYEQERTQGYMDGIAGTDIEVVAEGPGDWARDQARSVAEDFITAHPDLDLIFAESAEMGLGAAAAIDSAGLSDQIIAQTQDGTTESIQAVADGILDADLWHGFPTWGYRSVELAVMAVNGMEIPQQVDIGLRIIDSDSIDLFYPEPTEEVLGPIDWEGIVAHIEGGE